MKRVTRSGTLLAGLVLLLFALPAAASINKSIRIEDGAESNGESSVNGKITVGYGATVTGGLSTVNGKIRIGDNSSIEDAETVNGGIRIGDGVRGDDLETVNGSIDIGNEAVFGGSVTAVNGGLTIEQGSTVEGDVGNVNGDIELYGATIGGDVSTVAGDIEVLDGSVIRGGIVIEKPGGWWNNKRSRTPKVVIGPGSRVEGVIRVEREVELYISETAEVGGVEGIMSLDDAVRFSGDRP